MFTSGLLLKQKFHAHRTQNVSLFDIVKTNNQT